MVKILKKAVTKKDIHSDGLGYVLQNQNKEAILIPSNTEIQPLGNNKFKSGKHEFYLADHVILDSELMDLVYE